jgi:hypothetical protein
MTIMLAFAAGLLAGFAVAVAVAAALLRRDDAHEGIVAGAASDRPIETSGRGVSYCSSN